MAGAHALEGESSQPDCKSITQSECDRDAVSQSDAYARADSDTSSAKDGPWS